jgi:class 3 adenylate cyclase
MLKEASAYRIQGGRHLQARTRLIMNTETPDPGERRFDNPVFKKAIELASRFQVEQMKDDEKLTAEEIVTIGTRLGIEPGVMKRSLEQAEIGHSHGLRKKRSPFGSVQPLVRHEWVPFFLPFGLAVLWGSLAWFTGWIPFFCYITAPPMAAFMGFLTGKRKVGLQAARLMVFLLAVAMVLMMENPGGVLYFFLGSLIAGKLVNAGVELREEHFPLVEGAAASPEGEVSRQQLLQALMILQGELDKQKQRQAFLSVDVVGSTEIMTNAPEYEAEYTLHQFRNWVEVIVKENGGEVQSSAGDGMMCRFEEDLKAVHAARRLQQELPLFNSRYNKLPVPFRIRCGVSAGDAAVEAGKSLSDVQSPAVYRAAMLQKQAEPGGIVVGEEVSEAARGELGPMSLIPPAPETTGRAYACRCGQTATGS